MDSLLRIILFSVMAFAGLACLLRPDAIAQRMSIDKSFSRVIRFAGMIFLAYVVMRVINISRPTPVLAPRQYFGNFFSGGASALIAVLVLARRKHQKIKDRDQ